MKTNTNKRNLVEEIKKISVDKKSKFWKRIAKELEKPTSRRRIVNIYEISKFTKKGDVVMVPGKVLGTGDIEHDVTVIGYDFSNSAIEKIKNAKGNVMTIKEAIKKYPDGKKMRIIG